MKDLLSTSEVAAILRVSRIAILKKISKKQISAIKVGRNYVISKEEVQKLLGLAIGDENKKEIDNAVKKAVHQYGEVFRRLGKE
ncbi:MAG: helix-turn-helix domain-containing protein [bacterium]